jgi:hypothetical protein
MVYHGPEEEIVANDMVNRTLKHLWKVPHSIGAVFCEHMRCIKCCSSMQSRTLLTRVAQALRTHLQCRSDQTSIQLATAFLWTKKSACGTLTPTWHKFVSASCRMWVATWNKPCNEHSSARRAIRSLFDALRGQESHIL